MKALQTHSKSSQGRILRQAADSIDHFSASRLPVAPSRPLDGASQGASRAQRIAHLSPVSQQPAGTCPAAAIAELHTASR